MSAPYGDPNKQQYHAGTGGGAGGYTAQPFPGGYGGGMDPNAAAGAPWPQPMPQNTFNAFPPRPAGVGGQVPQKPGERLDDYQQRVAISQQQSQTPAPFINNLSAGEQLAANFFLNQWQTHGQQYTAGAHTFFQSLKFYFTVNNSYVTNKVKVLFMPFRHRNWRRIRMDDPVDGPGDGRMSKYATPANDINCPDLYLPLMSFVTYVLQVGYVKGATGQFSPEVIVQVGTSCLVTQILEILLIRLSLYLIHSQLGFLDLLAYTGYKYLSLVVNMAVGLQLGGTCYYMSMLYTGSMIAYAMLNTLKATLETSGMSGGKRRNYTIVGIGLAQLILVWFLGYNRELALLSQGSVLLSGTP